MGKGILLHPKYGLNPTMTTCYCCNEASEILLVGASARQFRDAGIDVSSDGQMPHNVGVMDGRPCTKCEKWMEKGVILISIRDGEEAVIDTANKNDKLPNPYRTGGWIVLKDEAVKRMINTPKILEHVLKKRMCFIPDTAWDKLGLPRGEVKGNGV